MRYPRRNLLVILFLGTYFVTGAAQPAEMSANIASSVIEKGQEFSINISIDPAGNSITGAQFNLYFNSSLVKIKNVTEGDIFKQGGGNTAFSSGTLNNTEGTLINVWDLIITRGANVSSKGNMATITMTATGTGITDFYISNVIISNPYSQAVQANITNGSVDIRSYDRSPPGSITNLRNTSNAQYYIEWAWADPIDADFSKVIVYLNGVFKTNISRGIQYYNATGLIPGTAYTISTRTIDIAGNANNTLVNHSTITLPGNLPTSDAVPPDSIRNLQSTSNTKYYLRWTWIDPGNPDFSKVMIYIDGKFTTNVTRGVQDYNARGLKSGTLHTISTRTVDTTGNINSTWINNSARTAAARI